MLNRQWVFYEDVLKSFRQFLLKLNPTHFSQRCYHPVQIAHGVLIYKIIVRCLLFWFVENLCPLSAIFGWGNIKMLFRITSGESGGCSRHSNNNSSWQPLRCETACCSHETEFSFSAISAFSLSTKYAPVMVSIKITLWVSQKQSPLLLQPKKQFLILTPMGLLFSHPVWIGDCLADMDGTDEMKYTG